MLILPKKISDQIWHCRFIFSMHTCLQCSYPATVECRESPDIACSTFYTPILRLSHSAETQVDLYFAITACIGLKHLYVVITTTWMLVDLTVFGRIYIPVEGMAHVPEETSFLSSYAASLMKAPQTVSLFSVGFPQGQLQRAPPSSFRIRDHTPCSLLLSVSLFCFEENHKPGPTSSVLSPVEWVRAQGLLACSLSTGALVCITEISPS